MQRRETISLLFGGLMSWGLGCFPSQSREGESEIGDKNNGHLLRPPGAQDEAIFLATCLRCGKCAQACKHQAVKIAHGEHGLSLGTPYIVPREAPCQLCLDCAKVCPSGALKPVEDKTKVRMGTACFNRDTCLSWQGDECKVCYTSCPLYGQAIKLEDHKFPSADDSVCTGCGICEYVCVNNPPSVRVKTRG